MEEVYKGGRFFSAKSLGFGGPTWLPVIAGVVCGGGLLWRCLNRESSALVQNPLDA
jgi:hypothetical protein